MSSPPDFMITVSREFGLDCEDIRQAKRNIESPALLDKLDNVIYSFLSLDRTSSDLKSALYTRVCSLLCRAGYRRPWFFSVRERLFALTWISIVTTTWRINACQCLAHESQSFPNIAVLFPDIFTVSPRTSQLNSIPLRNINFVTSSQSLNTTLSRKAAVLTDRRNRISLMLRLLKQQEIIRARLHAKITTKVNAINASYKRPLSHSDRRNIRRNLSLLPLALAIQPNEFPSARASTPASRKTSVPASQAAPLSAQAANYARVCDHLKKTMDHECKYFRWLGSAVGEHEGEENTEPAPVADLFSSELGSELGRSSEMLVLLEDAVGKLYTSGQIRANDCAGAPCGTPQGGGVSLEDVFVEANLDMEAARSVGFASELSDHDDANQAQKSTTELLFLARKRELRGELEGEEASADVTNSLPPPDLFEELVLGALPPPQPSVLRQSLSNLRAKHCSVLARAAQACDRYSPYDFSYT